MAATGLQPQAPGQADPALSPTHARAVPGPDPRRRRGPIPAPGRSRGDRHEPGPLRARRGLADGGSGHHLRWRGFPGLRRPDGRPRIHRAPPPAPRRAGPDPRPRGPRRSIALPVAAPALPGLRHPIHHRRSKPQAGRSGDPGGPAERGPAGGTPRHRTLRGRVHHRYPLHPRAQRGPDPHPGRGHLPHRRLEAGRGPASGPAL
jgi:hypothetical protein